MARGKQTEPIEVWIEDLAFGGEGVARHLGEVHFVAGAFPGERVRVLPLRGRKRWRKGRLIEILEPSPDRVRPRCSHTAVCGGCVYQCLTYERQLEAKERQALEAIRRIGGLSSSAEGPPLPAPETFHYRNKMEFSFAPRAWDPNGPPLEEAGGPALGLHVPGRFDAVFDVHDCALTDPEINDLLSLVRRFCIEHGLAGYHGRHRTGLLRHLVIRSSRQTGEWLLALVVREDDPRLRTLADLCRESFPRIAGFLLWIHGGLATVARADEEILLFGENRIVERLVGLDFELSASSFFQTNSRGAEQLLTEIQRMAPRVERLLDLYCGVGTLGLALAQHCRKLVGIEAVEAAVVDARRNAERNRIDHAEFHVDKAEDWLRIGRAFRPDLTVVDPPRAGLHPRALSGLITLAPPQLLYVSCNPTTLARDLQHLVESGYQLDRLRIIDLFPHTPHVETIVLLHKSILP